MSCFIKSAALIATLALAAPAALAERPVTRQVTVSYGDLNLESEAGAKALFSRIGNATRKVCGTRPAHIMNGALTRYFACRDSVTEATVRRIGSPNVSLAWAAQRAEPVQTASR
jgi:UrcA family protein